tara:strand:- start:195327 stop:196946 length:1620 start_codon:yes stop_codon:yes gene_type:complete
MSKLILNSITVKNFATFENQTIEFDNKYNAIAGETGSGKSLILDAFQFLLGQRADKKVVRKNSNSAVIEGIFSCYDQNILNYFEEIGYPVFDNQIIIKRIISNSGQSKSSLNDLSCSLATLTNFSKRYIDLVGQFENQKLLSPNYQLKLLDTYGDHLDLLGKYEESYNTLQGLYQKKVSLEANLSQREQRLDYINFQLEQLNSLDLDVDVEKSLIQAKHSYLNAEKKNALIQNLNNIFTESDTSIVNQLNNAQKLAANNSNLIKEEITNKIEEAKNYIEDLSYELTNIDRDDLSEEDFNTVIDELDVFQKLKRKFNVETSELVEIKSSFEKEQAELMNIDNELSEINNSISSIENDCWTQANKLHDLREKCSQKLSKEITNGVQALNMNGATIRYGVVKSETLTKYGSSIASITAETNPGEGFFNLKDIASGGELSRVLLTLRRVVSKTDSISIFFFDEIDTGIGGETAKKIAQMLKTVSGKSQVIAITHLPQLASVADVLIVVAKETIQDGKKTRTFSKVSKLSGKEQDSYVTTLAGL